MSNYLYNKIIDWAVEAQQSNIDFGDMKKTRKGTLNQIEKLILLPKNQNP